MKTILFIFIISTMLAGCTTQRKCNRKFPPQISTTIKDSIAIRFDTVKITTKYYHYDTILRVMDTVVTVIQYDETGAAYSDYSFLENEFCQSLAKVNGKLKHELELKEQTRVLTGVQIAEVINTYVQHFKETEKDRVREVNRLTWWQRTLIVLGWVFIGLVVSMAGYVIIRLKVI